MSKNIDKLIDNIIGFEDWIMDNYNKYHKPKVASGRINNPDEPYTLDIDEANGVNITREVHYPTDFAEQMDKFREYPHSFISEKEEEILSDKDLEQNG